MKTTDRDIHVSYGRTTNLGNYESERVDVGISRDLDDEEDRKTAMRKELKNLKEFVEESIE